jgi:GNAT superfamily N-acetyltransferase
MAPETLVLPADDPRVAESLALGWRVIAESWGARLTVTDDVLRRLAERLEVARRAGYSVDELRPDASSMESVWHLQQATRGDFPVTPATPAPEQTLPQLSDSWRTGWRVFGARHRGQLVGTTIARPAPDVDVAYAETEWTAVLAEHRGRGLATALKAASVLALAADGVRVFGTGGASTNTASLAMNAAAGYTVTERWVSLQRAAS